MQKNKKKFPLICVKLVCDWAGISHFYSWQMLLVCETHQCKIPWENTSLAELKGDTTVDKIKPDFILVTLKH